MSRRPRRSPARRDRLRLTVRSVDGRAAAPHWARMPRLSRTPSARTRRGGSASRCPARARVRSDPRGRPEAPRPRRRTAVGPPAGASSARNRPSRTRIRSTMPCVCASSTRLSTCCSSQVRRLTVRCAASNADADVVRSELAQQSRDPGVVAAFDLHELEPRTLVRRPRMSATAVTYRESVRKSRRSAVTTTIAELPEKLVRYRMFGRAITTSASSWSSIRRWRTDCRRALRAAVGACAMDRGEKSLQRDHRARRTVAFRVRRRVESDRQFGPGARFELPRRDRRPFLPGRDRSGPGSAPVWYWVRAAFTSPCR